LKTSRPDFFGLLGLPRKLRIDMNDFEQRYRALSRQLHPDYFHNASAAERRASLEKTSLVNDAYRTLRNPASRLQYLLEVEGMPVGGATGQATVPPDLLEEVFALNEELDEIRAERASGAAPDAWRPRLERARRPIDAKRAAHEAEVETLSARWDAAVDGGAPVDERRRVLAALRDRVLERTYINNLLAAVERELA
jgi:molecular chaperone HscB